MGGPPNVFLFARAPVLGAVKTRLAADIGAVAALRFYRETLAASWRRLDGDPRWNAWIAATPDRAARSPRPWPAGARLLPQGPGDLGRRMARVLARFSGTPAVIVGSDIPDLRPRHVARAVALLRGHDAVFGPAGDGGYWLVGVRDMARLAGMFAGVRWSTPDALADTLANLKGRRVAFADRLDDVDDGAAFARWRAEVDRAGRRS